jgi:putative membrane protein
MEMWGFEHYGMGWGMVLVWLIPILLIALVVFYSIRGRDGKDGHTALDILKARYARGEIDREEFLKRRNDLTE